MTTIYPFDRFRELAKKVLTNAQQEAEVAHHSYSGTERLPLGLLISRRCGFCQPS